MTLTMPIVYKRKQFIFFLFLSLPEQTGHAEFKSENRFERAHSVRPQHNLNIGHQKGSIDDLMEIMFFSVDF